MGKREMDCWLSQAVTRRNITHTRFTSIRRLRSITIIRFISEALKVNPLVPVDELPKRSRRKRVLLVSIRR